MRPTDQSAHPAAAAPERARSEAESLLGDSRALLEHLGSPGLVLEAPGAFWGATSNTTLSLAQFLEDYLVRLLQPCELPAIIEACRHAKRGELRELLAQDHCLEARLASTPFAEPSRRMGRLQLARLRPLHDDRLAQRYLATVESGQAHGWHTLVYGVILAVYSLPLRQGLLYYSQETLSALALAAGRSKSFGPSEAGEMPSALWARLPQAVEAALAADPCRELWPKG